MQHQLVYKRKGLLHQAPSKLEYKTYRKHTVICATCIVPEPETIMCQSFPRVYQHHILSLALQDSTVYSSLLHNVAMFHFEVRSQKMQNIARPSP